MYGKGEQKMANRIMLNQTSYHGAGAIAEIVNEAKAHDYKKAFVCSDPDLIKFQVSTKVTDLLVRQGFPTRFIPTSRQILRLRTCRPVWLRSKNPERTILLQSAADLLWIRQKRSALSSQIRNLRTS